jgi:hypothetical protein
LTRISQFVGRLARVNRALKSQTSQNQQKTERQTPRTDRQTDGQTQDTGVISLIQFYCIQTFIQGKCLISAYLGPVFYLPLLVESCTGNGSLLTHFKPLQY